jgi:hypothetical protein
LKNSWIRFKKIISQPLMFPLNVWNYIRSLFLPCSYSIHHVKFEFETNLTIFKHVSWTLHALHHKRNNCVNGNLT